MSKFDSGVSSYIHASAKVDVYFPVDQKGNADVSCRQCDYFWGQSRKCGLNGKVCQYPDKYVGAMCPLKLDEEVE